MRIPRVPRVTWLFLAGFLALVTSLDLVHDYVGRRGEGHPISIAFEIKWGLLYWLPYFVLGPAVIFLVDRYRISLARPRAFVIHAAAGLVFAYLHVMIASLSALPLGPALSYWGRFFVRLQYDFALDYLLYCVIVVAAYMLQKYSDFKEGEIRASQLEVGLAQTRLRTIQAQLNPHFFFNTLQAISVLALAGERDSVVDMLNRLSSLLRVSFDRHRPQQISLAAEMEFLDSYLAIHQLSLGSRLTVHYDIAPDTLDAAVPAMLLQPLVENAIVHGLSVKPGNGIIRICARRVDGILRLEVADSGPGFKMAQPNRSGVGLSATESRLQLLYGDNQSISYSRSEEGGANVTVAIPFAAASVQRLAAVEKVA